MVGAVTKGSESFPDLATSETTGADADAPGRSVDHGADTLKVGVEGSLGLIIGVTDVVARLRSFRADVTCKCHGVLLHSEINATIER